MKQLVKSFSKIPVLVRLFIDSSQILRWISLQWSSFSSYHVYHFSANSALWRSNILICSFPHLRRTIFKEMIEHLWLTLLLVPRKLFAGCSTPWLVIQQFAGQIVPVSPDLWPFILLNCSKPLLPIQKSKKAPLLHPPWRWMSTSLSTFI